MPKSAGFSEKNVRIMFLADTRAQFRFGRT